MWEIKDELICTLRGQLWNGQSGSVKLSQSFDSQKGRKIWIQRSDSNSTKMLNRDYVCATDTLETILVDWAPCDWALFTVEMHDDENST